MNDPDYSYPPGLFPSIARDHEAVEVLHVHFGKRYELHVRNDLSVEEKDDQASQIIMENIARLLPVHLRGEFA